jgi:hypothetical protein
MKTKELKALANAFEKTAIRTFDEDIETALRAVYVLEGWLATIQHKYQFEPNVRDDFGSRMEQLKAAAHRIQKALANLNPWMN